MTKLQKVGAVKIKKKKTRFSVSFTKREIEAVIATIDRSPIHWFDYMGINVQAVASAMCKLVAASPSELGYDVSVVSVMRHAEEAGKGKAKQ